MMKRRYWIMGGMSFSLQYSLQHDYNLFISSFSVISLQTAQYQVPITLLSFLSSLFSALGLFSC